MQKLQVFDTIKKRWFWRAVDDLGGGGDGGSLPDWWTVDEDPRTVDFSDTSVVKAQDMVLQTADDAENNDGPNLRISAGLPSTFSGVYSPLDIGDWYNSPVRIGITDSHLMTLSEPMMGPGHDDNRGLLHIRPKRIVKTSFVFAEDLNMIIEFYPYYTNFHYVLHFIQGDDYDVGQSGSGTTYEDPKIYTYTLPVGATPHEIANYITVIDGTYGVARGYGLDVVPEGLDVTSPVASPGPSYSSAILVTDNNVSDDPLFEIEGDGSVNIAGYVNIEGPGAGFSIAASGPDSPAMQIYSSAGPTLFQLGADEANVVPLLVSEEGKVIVRQFNDNDAFTVKLSAGGDPVFLVGPTGAITIDPSDYVTPLTIIGATNADSLLSVLSGSDPRFIVYPNGVISFILDPDSGFFHVNNGSSDLMGIGPTGAVTISPTSPDVTALKITAVADQTVDIFEVKDVNGYGLYVTPNGAVMIDSNAPEAALYVQAEQSETIFVGLNADGAVFTLASDGGVTIKSSGHVGDFVDVFQIKNPENDTIFWVDSEGDVNITPLSANAGFSVLGILQAVRGATVNGADGKLGFFGATPVTRPEIPATPTAQDIADILVALGLATQAA